jgi:nitroimidazol reductase NimA-like FMN-containing flavoprotein (pyridoxamine 5'-phosphate oxidase superfamily)
VKQRDQVAMTTGEAAELLAAGRKVQLATNGPDGFPHLVTMYYVVIDGLITFWTYRKSQKALNLERDPRISCLVEDGEEYFDLRGVLVQGTARRIEDPAVVAEIGRRITAVTGGPMAGADPGALAQYVEHAASKRYGYRVEPGKVISWDHAKLASG